MGRELVVERKGRFRFGLALTERNIMDPSIAFNDWADIMTSFSYQGLRYSLPGMAQEEIGANYAGLARSAYKQNGVVFACILLRMLTFSEPTFKFRQYRSGSLGDYFGTAALAPLEQPGPTQTTGDLLATMIQHADLAGNWFGTTRYGGITTLRPDWITIVAGNQQDDANLWDPATQVVGYAYQPGGPGSGEDIITFLPEEIAHFAPVRDPEARFRGMSWLTPVIREIQSDKALSDFKLKFTENSATPNMVVKFPLDDVQKYAMWIEKFREQHESSANAFKTLFLGAGMDATPIGADFRHMDFKHVQGAGETRIAAAAGTPPVLVGLSEGLESATYSNYGMARRRFGDMTMRPLWRNAADSLAPIIAVPSGAKLVIDPRDIAFLQEDQKDAAEIMQRKMAAIGSAIINGFEPDSAVAAIAANDETKLVHTGLVSVQLQAPGTAFPNSSPNGSSTTLPTIPKQGTNSSRAMEELLALAIRSQEPPSVTFEQGAIQARFDAPVPADVHVDVNVPDMPPQEPPVVNVTVESAAAKRKRLEWDEDRRSAVITEEEDEDLDGV